MCPNVTVPEQTAWLVGVQSWKMEVGQQARTHTPKHEVPYQTACMVGEWTNVDARMVRSRTSLEPEGTLRERTDVNLLVELHDEQ